MQRRNVILGLGTIAASGATVLGSGAFTSVEADRSVAVEVADDSDAFLALISTSEYAADENGTLSVDLSPNNPTDAGGQGVNANAETFIKDAFEIKNQGTQTARLSFDDGGEDDQRIELGIFSEGISVRIFPADDDIDLTLDPGDDVSFNIKIEAGDIGSVEDINETVTITAEATDD